MKRRAIVIIYFIRLDIKRALIYTLENKTLFIYNFFFLANYF